MTLLKWLTRIRTTAHTRIRTTAHADTDYGWPGYGYGSRNSETTVQKSKDKHYLSSSLNFLYALLCLNRNLINKSQFKEWLYNVKIWLLMNILKLFLTEMFFFLWICQTISQGMLFYFHFRAVSPLLNYKYIFF